MGTSNFHNENATRIYADECDYEGAYEDLVSNVRYSLQAKDEAKTIQFTFDDDISLDSELRSFPARSIGTVYENFSFLNADINVELIPLVRSGYYEGANLDYEVSFILEGENFESITDLISAIQDYPEDYDTTPGLIAIHSNNLQNRLEKSFNTLVEETEATFAELTIPLIRLGGLSDGTSVYEAA